jgi:hypothetical protein
MEYYFLVPPDQMLSAHFPREAKWQLTKKPLAINQFEQEPRLTGLFELGMSVETVREAMKGGQEVVQSFGPAGVNVVTAKVPLTRRLKAGTEYQFEVKSPDTLRLYLGNNMKPPVLLDKEGDVYRATIRPEKGDLKFGWMVEGEKEGTRLLHYLVE